ncbi:MAG TPA: helix-turn-helix domain-containing protein [Solirubrobacterales bacterium]|jgi:DNA-binding transcriptional ArsR family regulator|nr:helix-turn-helix domain-containing protein [Solirubrobacterales bacterium]
MPTQNGHSPHPISANGDSYGKAPENGYNANNGRPALPVNWERLARATAHPLRVSILEILGIDGGRVLSPSDLSRELQIPLSNTNYHVTELAKSGLIELVRERQVRGATEHFYRLPEAAATAGREDAEETAEGGEDKDPVEEARRAWAMV